jgi:hypothetical protein
MEVILLFLLFVLITWVYAADGDSLELPYAEFIEVDDTTAKLFQEAGCKEDSFACEFPGNDVLYGSFTSSNATEAIMLSDIPCEGPCQTSELFRFVDGSWKQIRVDSDESLYFQTGKYCRKILASDKREMLLRESRFVAYSYDTGLDIEYPPDYEFWLLDFSKVPIQTVLFSTYEREYQSPFCDDISPNESFNLLDDFEMTIADLNEDSLLDITVTMRETEISSLQCGIWDGERGSMKLGGSPPIKHELYWLFDGETFTPMPETKVFLETLKSQQ